MKIKYIKCILFSFWFFCAALLWTRPVWCVQNQTEAGIAFFKSGYYQKAFDVLLAAFEETPEDLDLNFFLGRAAFETGDYEMAVMVFERVLIQKPDEQRVKLEMARAFHRLGANDIARKYCTEVLDSGPPETVRKNINAFLVYLDSTEQKWFFNGSLSTAVEWNNNIWASPSSKTVRTIIGDITLSGETAQKEQDWILSSTFSTDLTYRFNPTRHTWKTQMDLYQSIYQDASALDTRYVGIASGPEFRWGPGELRIEALLTQIELGRSRYLESTGIRLTFNWPWRSDLFSSTAVKYESKKYSSQADKDADNVRIDSSISHFYKHIWYSVGFSLATEQADDDENSYLMAGINGSLSKELPFKINGSLNYEYQHTRYEENADLFSQDRKDNRHTAQLLFWKKIVQFENPDRYLNLYFNYQHIWALSNVALYEYHLDMASVYMTFYF